MRRLFYVRAHTNTFALVPAAVTQPVLKDVFPRLKQGQSPVDRARVSEKSLNLVGDISV
jgi:hypothetical protein